MKLISNKKWDEMNQKYVDLQLDLDQAKSDNGTYFMQVDELNKKLKDERLTQSKLVDENAGLVTANGLLKSAIKDKDKEVRKLKALLTKNKIDYKHLYKEEK